MSVRQLTKRFGADAAYFTGTFDQEDLRKRFVHRADHPRHRALLDVVSDGLFDDAIVVLGNLTEPRRGGGRPEGRGRSSNVRPRGG